MGPPAKNFVQLQRSHSRHTTREKKLLATEGRVKDTNGVRYANGNVEAKNATKVRVNSHPAPLREGRPLNKDAYFSKGGQITKLSLD
jgi:hypothetical protein